MRAWDDVQEFVMPFEGVQGCARLCETGRASATVCNTLQSCAKVCKGV